MLQHKESPSKTLRGVSLEDSGRFFHTGICVLFEAHLIKTILMKKKMIIKGNQHACGWQSKLLLGGSLHMLHKEEREKGRKR